MNNPRRPPIQPAMNPPTGPRTSPRTMPKTDAKVNIDPPSMKTTKGMIVPKPAKAPQTIIQDIGTP